MCVTGRGRWLQGQRIGRLSRSPLLLELKEHLTEGDRVVGTEPPGGDPAAVDTGPIGAAQIPDLDPIRPHDQLGVAPGDRRIVDGDVAGHAPSNDQGTARLELKALFSGEADETVGHGRKDAGQRGSGEAGSRH